MNGKIRTSASVKGNMIGGGAGTGYSGRLFFGINRDFCPKDCKKRGEQVRGPFSTSYEALLKQGVPWCFQYITELEWKDKEAGICFKCEKCLNE